MLRRGIQLLQPNILAPLLFKAQFKACCEEAFNSFEFFGESSYAAVLY